MSFDLMIVSKTGPLPVAGVFEFLRQRPNYVVENGQALYENDDTGVHFTFEEMDEVEDDEVEMGSQTPHVAFNLNFFRPSFFALEAAIELAALTDQFDLAVIDPQIDDVNPQPFNSDAFIASWNDGNRWATPSILKQGGEEDSVARLPTARLTEIWEWNYNRKARQEQLLNSDVTVPVIHVVKHQGVTLSACLWADGCSMEVLRPDAFLMIRDKLAPRRLFGRKEEFFLVPYRDLIAVLGPFDKTPNSPVLTLQYPSVPSSIEKFIQKYAGRPLKGSECSPERVLDREYFETA